MSSCGSNAGMEMSASLVYAIVNETLFHLSSHINQMLRQITHILHFFLVYPVFVDNWIEVGD